MVAATPTYGLIGLGQMGHGMAKNIRLRVPESSIVDRRKQSGPIGIGRSRKSNTRRIVRFRHSYKRRMTLGRSEKNSATQRDLYYIEKTSLKRGRREHSSDSNAISLQTAQIATSILVVYDINKETVQHFVADYGRSGNVVAASSPKEVAERADIIMTSVPQAAHVKQVFLSPQTGLLAAGKPSGCNTLFLELSTIDAKVSIELAETIAAGGYGLFVDAPCSGGAMGAESGSLSFMVGCSNKLYPEVFEICKLMGKEDSIFHCGELGSGLKTKLLNNYLSSLTAMATGETMNIGLRMGLDARKLNQVLNASSGMNFNSKINNPVPGLTPNNAASKGYVGGFSLELCLGVLELGYKAAQDIGARTVLGKPMLEAFRDASKDPKFQGKDSKIIYKWLGGEDPVIS